MYVPRCKTCSCRSSADGIITNAHSECNVGKTILKAHTIAKACFVLMSGIVPCQGSHRLQYIKACRSRDPLRFVFFGAFRGWHVRKKPTRVPFKGQSISTIRVSASFYSVLQVDAHASREEIRKAYRRLSRRYHPDVDSSPEAQKALQVPAHSHACSEPCSLYLSQWQSTDASCAGHHCRL